MTIINDRIIEILHLYPIFFAYIQVENKKTTFDRVNYFIVLLKLRNVNVLLIELQHCCLQIFCSNQL